MSPRLRATGTVLAVAAWVGVAAPPTRAAGAIAVSRELSLQIPPNAQATIVMSRELSLDIPPNAVGARAVSHELSLYIPPGAISTYATSRELTLFTFFTFTDAATALRIAAGLQSATALQAQVYNIVTTAPSSNAVDIADALAIARNAAHPEEP